MLRGSLKQYAKFPAESVRPTPPPALLQWWSTRVTGGGDNTLVVGSASDCSDDALPGGAGVPAGGVASFAGPLLPSMTDLPPVKRCDAMGVTTIRHKVAQSLRCLGGLVSLTIRLEGRWGRLTVQEREELRAAVQAVERANVTEQDLLDCFVELDFTHTALEELSEELRRCRRVQTLRLSENPFLGCLGYTPLPACHTVLACACALQTIAPSAASTTLTVLGVSFNQLTSLDFVELFPALRVLDVSGNRLCELDRVLDTVQSHPTLVEVSLQCNPIALLDGYRRRVASGCPKLEVLDRRIVRAEERQFPLTAVGQPAERAQGGALPPLASSSTQVAGDRVLPTVKRATRLALSRKAPHGSPPPAAQPTTGEVVQVEVTPEEVMRAWRVKHTVAAAVEVLAVRGLSTLTHIPVRYFSEADLLPDSALCQRAAGQHVAPTAAPGVVSRQGSGPRRERGSVTVVSGPGAAAGGGGRRANAAAKAAPQGAPLYECRSFLTLRGRWGAGSSEEVGKAQTALSEADSHSLSAPPPPPLPEQPRDAAGETGKARVLPPLPPLAASVTVELTGIQLNPPPESLVGGGGGGAGLGGGAAQSRLRRAVQAAANAVVDDVLYPPADHGLFSADLPLREPLCEELRCALQLEVEVRDEVVFTDPRALRSALESTATGGGGGAGGARHHTRRETDKGDPARQKDAAQSVTTTHTYTIGTIHLDPCVLFLPPGVALGPSSDAASSSPSRPSLPPAHTADGTEMRREWCVCQCTMRQNEAAFVTARHRLREARVELQSAMECYTAAVASLHSGEDRGTGSAGGAGGGAGGVAPGSAASSSPKAPRSSRGTSASPSTTGGHKHRVAPPQPAAPQSEYELQCSAKVTEAAARCLALESRLEELQRASVSVDAKFILGRGPAPPCSAQEAALQRDRGIASGVVAKGGKGAGRGKKPSEAAP